MFTIEAVFQVSTIFKVGLHRLSFTHLFWIWTIQTKGTTYVCRRCNIPDYKYDDSAGEQCKSQLIWSPSVLELLFEFRLHLQLSSVIFSIWLSEFWFETFRSIQIWIISTFYALFYCQSINFSLDLSFSFVFWIYSGNCTCLVGEEWCHHLSPVSHNRCHYLNLVSKERFCLKITYQQLHLHGAR